MQEFLIDIFGSFGRTIVFLHIVSAAFLIGSMFMIKFIIKPALMMIDDESVRYSRCIKILDRYFVYLLAVMILVISASLTMSAGLGFEFASPTLYSLIHAKEALWLFVAFNFIYMYAKLINTKKFYKRREFFEVHENLSLIVNSLIPLNFILTLIAAYIGVIIREF